VGVLLAVDGDGLVPLPHGLEELAVLSFGRVELSEGVALVVRSDVESGQVVLAADDEGTTDHGVVVLAVHGGRAEDVLARSLKAGVEPTNEVVGHEDEGELVVVLVVHAPDRVLVERNLLPEVLESLSLVVVGEVALVLVKREGSAGKKIKRVLGLRGLSRLLIGVGSSRSGLGSGLGGSLGGIGLLGGDVGQSRLVEELKLLGNGRIDGLVDDSLIPTGDVGVLLAPLSVEEVLETTGDQASTEQVGEGDAVTDEVGVAEEVLLNNGDGAKGLLGGVIDCLLVVRVLAEEGSEPATERREDLGVEEGHPLQDGGVVLLGLAEEGGLLVLGGDVDGDSNALRESKAILALESRDLSQRVGLEKLSRSLARLVLGVGQVKTVGLCNRLDGSAAGVVL
jgi:hypothetical protein